MLETSPIAPDAPAPPAQTMSRRSVVRALAGIVMTLVLGLGGVFAIFAITRYSQYSVQYPASLTAPDGIGSLTRSRDGALEAAERELAASSSAFSALYLAPGRRVFITGRADRILVPDRAVPALPVDGAYRVDPAPVGGRVNCAVVAPTVTVCAWADHGSAGLVRFSGWGPAEVPQLLADVRAATIVRG